MAACVFHCHHIAAAAASAEGADSSGGWSATHAHPAIFPRKCGSSGGRGDGGRAYLVRGRRHHAHAMWRGGLKAAWGVGS